MVIKSEDVRRQTRTTYLCNLFFLILDPTPQSLNLCKQHNHQCQMLINTFLQGTLIGQSQSYLFDLNLKILVLVCQSLYLATQIMILNRFIITIEWRDWFYFLSSLIMPWRRSNSVYSLRMLSSYSSRCLLAV